MGLPAKKIDDELSPVVELSTDREQGLSNNFEDPVLEDMIPGLVAAPNPSPLSIVQEAAEAVQELVTEASVPAVPEGVEAIDLKFAPDSDSHPIEAGELSKITDTNLSMPADSVEEPVHLMVMEGANSTEDNFSARWDMSEKLFQLVVCERIFDDLVEASLASIMGALGAHAGAVLELDGVRQEYFFRASIGGGDPEKVKTFRVPLNKGIVGHVGESRQATLLRDLEADQMQMRAISMSVSFEAKTCMAAPILVSGQLYGVIEIFNRKDGGFFEQRDLQLLEDGTRMLAKVLEVRFLMAELMKRGE